MLSLPAGSGVLIALSVLLIGSSVGLVYTQHARRTLFGELRELEQTRDQLQIEWGQLQIEQSTLAAPERVEQLAAEKLRLYSPDAQQVELLLRSAWTNGEVRTPLALESVPDRNRSPAHASDPARAVVSDSAVPARAAPARPAGGD
ncbi:MAG: cell division protein FtsL [Gammaproteobacteria bacterium]|nr:cell division protein FtsL [Gammaproteobacteria bacterium]